MGGYLATLTAQTRDTIKAIYLMAPGFNFLERWQKKLKNSQVEGPLIPVFHYRYNKEVFLNTNLFICTDLHRDLIQIKQTHLKSGLKN